MDRERGGSTTVNSGSKRRTSVIVTLPDGIKPGDWFRTEDRNGTEFAFQLPEGVSGGQKVEVEVPGEKKSTVVKVRVPEGANPGDVIKAYSRDGVKFKIAVPEGKGPGDIIRASVPISGAQEKKYDVAGMVYERNGGDSNVPAPRPRRSSTQRDSHSGSPAPPRRRTSTAVTDSPRSGQGSPAGSGHISRGGHEVDVGGDYSFTPEQTRARNARRPTVVASELCPEEEAKMHAQSSRRRSSVEILGELMLGMHPAQPMDKMDEGAGATAPDLHKAVAADRRRRSSVSSDPALMAMAAARHQAAGASSSPRDRTDGRPEPLNMRAFASEMRSLVSPGPNSGSPLARVKGGEGGGRIPMSGGGRPLARIRAEEDAGGRGAPIPSSIQRVPSTVPSSGSDGSSNVTGSDYEAEGAALPFRSGSSSPLHSAAGGTVGRRTSMQILTAMFQRHQSSEESDPSEH